MMLSLEYGTDEADSRTGGGKKKEVKEMDNNRYEVDVPGNHGCGHLHSSYKAALRCERHERAAARNLHPSLRNSPRGAFVRMAYG